jgi:hypothetical protein
MPIANAQEVAVTGGRKERNAFAQPDTIDRKDNTNSVPAMNGAK